MSFDLDLSAVNPLLANVRSVFTPAVSNEILLNAGRKVGVAAEGLVSEYPAASGKPLPLYYPRIGKDGKTFYSKFKSLKQQRFVMALVAKGKVPYRRTGQLGRSILSDPQLSGNGLVIVRIGSNLKYAPYVIDAILQSHYHMGTWTPIQSDIAEGMPMLRNVAIRSITADVNRRIKGG